MKEISIFGIIVLLTVMPISSSFNTSLLLDDNAEWTVMFYFDGDQSETTYSLSDKMVADLENLKRIGSTEEVNFIVLIDGDGGNDSHLYYILKDEVDEIPLTSVNESWVDEINMGNEDTLIDFMSWTVENYPAKHYNVYLNDHGGGWYGICADEHPEYDILNLTELKNAFSRLGKKIDVVSMDACLMAMVEIAYQLRGYVDYLVASESFIHTHEIDGGLLLNWRVDEIYGSLVNNSNMTAEELCIESVDDFRTDKAFVLPPNIIRPQAVDCISAINVSMIDDVVVAVDELAKNLMSKRPFHRLFLSLAFLKTQKFSGGFDFLGYSFYPYLDLYDFCKNIERFFPDMKIKGSAEEVMVSIEKAVIAERHGERKLRWEHPDSHGLSIYLPYRKITYNEGYELLDFAKDTNWVEFIRNRWIFYL